MNEIRFLIYVVLAILSVITCYLVILNRNSEIVKTNFLTAVAVGILGALLTLFFSLKTEERSLSFHVEYVLDNETGVPFVSDAFINSSLYMDAGGWSVFSAWSVLADFPEWNKESINATDKIVAMDNAELQHLYRRVLMRQIIDTLRFTYFKSWDADPAHIDLPSGNSQTTYAPCKIKPGRKLNNSEIVALFNDDKAFDSSFLRYLNLPPDTDAKAILTDDEMVFKFNNSYVEISISVAERGIVQGLGFLRGMCRVKFEDANNFRRPRYAVKLLATFNKVRSGHPNMPLYKRWVDVMISEISRFDSESRWKDAKERYLLYYASHTQTPMDEMMDETRRKAELNQK